MKKQDPWQSECQKSHIVKKCMMDFTGFHIHIQYRKKDH